MSLLACLLVLFDWCAVDCWFLLAWWVVVGGWYCYVLRLCLFMVICCCFWVTLLVCV